MTMRAALYARVSTEEQADEGHSLDAQLRVMRDYCARREWTVVAEYVDPGQSGRSLHRPSVERLLSEAARTPPPFDVVVVHKLDRWSRSIIDTIATLRDLATHNVAFAAATQNIDYTTPEGKLLLMMLAVFAEIYIDNLRAETTKGKKERALKGLYNGSLPFGYVPGTAKGLPPALEPAAIEGYRLAMRLAADGGRPSEISDVLNEAGFRTNGHWGHRPFTADTVLHILKNRFYLGEVQYRGEWLAGKHPMAIDLATWQRAQEAIAHRRVSPARANKGTRAYPLRQLLYCAECGQSFIGWTLKGRRRYLDTARRKRTACTQPTTLVADEIEGALGKIFSGVQLPDDWQEQALEMLGDTKEERDDTHKRRESVKREIARAKTLFLLGDIDEEEYRTLSKRGREKLSALVPPPDSLDLRHAASVLLGFPDAWQKSSLEYRERMLRMMLHRVYVKNGSIVAIEPHSEFYPLLKVADGLRIRERRDSVKDAYAGTLLVLVPPGSQFTL